MHRDKLAKYGTLVPLHWQLRKETGDLAQEKRGVTGRITPLVLHFCSLSYLHHLLCFAIDGSDNRLITVILLPYFNNFPNDLIIYLYKVYAARDLHRFYNPSRDVENSALFASGQLQRSAEDGCGKELSCFNGVDNCFFLNANRPRQPWQGGQVQPQLGGTSFP